MKVSIIIPNYNCKPYLGKCINSVKTQSYRDWECIIVDDASTDGSQQAIWDLIRNDERFTFILKKENEGLSAARNTGMDHSLGDVYFFLDSDDWLERNALQWLVAEADAHPEAGRIIGLCQNIWPGGRATPWSITPTGMHGPDDDHFFSGRECDPGHATAGLYIQSRIPVKLRFPRVRLFEDMIFNMWLMFAGVLSFVTDRYVYMYRRRPDSLVSLNITHEDADAMRKALHDCAEPFHPRPEVYERCVTFLENAMKNRIR